MVQSQGSVPPWRRRQFGFRALAMFSTIVATVAAIYGGLIRGGTTWPIYVVLGCAAPVLLLIIVDGLQWVANVAAARHPTHADEDDLQSIS
jgi:hypothetical protein